MSVLIEDLKAEITLKYLLGVEVKELKGLSQFEEMFVEVRSLERLDNIILAAATVRVAMLGKNNGVVFTGDNGTEDGQTTGSSDVTDDVVELKVHLV